MIYKLITLDPLLLRCICPLDPIHKKPIWHFYIKYTVWITKQHDNSIHVIYIIFQKQLTSIPIKFTLGGVVHGAWVSGGPVSFQSMVYLSYMLNPHASYSHSPNMAWLTHNSIILFHTHLHMLRWCWWSYHLIMDYWSNIYVQLYMQAGVVICVKTCIIKVLFLGSESFLINIVKFSVSEYVISLKSNIW